MNAYGLQLIEALLRSGLVLTIAAGGVWLFLRISDVTSPSLRRMLWFAVVLQGCLLVRLPVTTPSIPFLPKTVSREVPTQNDSQSFFHLPAIAIEVADILFSADSPSESRRHGSARSSRGWGTLLAAVWVTGLAVIIIRGAWFYGKFLRCLPNASVTPKEWIDEWQSLLNDAKVKRRVLLRTSPHMGPLLCWHPSGYQLIVPEGVWRLLEPRQRIMIMRHELAHLTRGDIWKSFALHLLALPHWFNPLVWWAVKQFDEDAEKACDDAVRQSSPALAIDYARTLLLLGGSHGETLFASQAAGSHGLAGRIRRLLVSNSRKDSNMKKLTIVTLVLGLSVLHLLRFQSQAEDRPAETEAPATGPINITIGDGIHFSGNGLTIEAGQQNGRTEAVVDMAYLFPRLDQFVHQREQLKKEIAEREAWAKDEMQRFERASDKTAARAEFDKKRKEFSQEFLGKERGIYLAAYKSIGAEIESFARENGIRVVRRVDRHADVNPNVHTESAKAAATTGTTGVVNLLLANPTTSAASAAPKDDQARTIQGLVTTASAVANLYYSTPLIPVSSQYKEVVSTKNAMPGFAFNGAPLKDYAGETVDIQVPTLTLIADSEGVPKGDKDAANNKVSFVLVNNVVQNHSSTVAGGPTLMVETIAVGSEAPESIESLMRKEVLFAESSDEYDITQQILKRLNAKFQSEQATNSAK